MRLKRNAQKEKEEEKPGRHPCDGRVVELQKKKIERYDRITLKARQSAIQSIKSFKGKHRKKKTQKTANVEERPSPVPDN